MERREWWTDDLITAVCAAGNDGEVDYWMTSDQVYRIIAAVEDWQKNHALMSPVGLLWEQQSAIQQVRETCRATNSVRMSIDDSWLPGWDLAVEYVLRALDGERDG